MKSIYSYHSEDLATSARAYFSAAELIYKNEIERSRNWLHVGDWYVVHHLAFIASELFAKRISQSVEHDLVSLEANFTTFHGHKSNFEKLTVQVQQQLRSALSPRSLELFRSLSADDLAIGRYPFERDMKPFKNLPEGQGVPLSEIEPATRYTNWRDLAEDWLKLARELNDLLEGHYWT